MKRCISIIRLCALMLTVSTPGFAGEALERFFGHIATHTLQSDFVLTLAEDASQPMNYPGAIRMRGEQFALTLFDMEAAYDGQTLYVYSESTDELTLSQPTAEELLEANPFLYARALADVCTITEQTTKDGKTTIVLTPKEPSAGIQKFTLVLKGNLPQQLTLKEGKKQTVLRMQNPAYLASTDTDANAFRLQKPDAYVNDMR